MSKLFARSPLFRQCGSLIFIKKLSILYIGAIPKLVVGGKCDKNTYSTGSLMSKHNSKHGNTEPQPGLQNSEEEAEAKASVKSAANAEAENAADSPPDPDAASEAEAEAAEGGQNSVTFELATKLAELNDQYLRKAADFENFRKRVNREKQELTEFANQSLIVDILPVLDDFERAVKSAETSSDFASFYEGIAMISKQLASLLENKWGLKPFNSQGEVFDPNRHEAIQMEKTAGISEPVVKEDYVKGYLLKDRVIRFAKVKVLMPEEGEKAPEAGGAS